jgi:triacylglycerol lipase
MSTPRVSSSSLHPAVLLVPGWSDTARQLRRCRSFLLESGWQERQVSCLSFRDRYGSNIAHAAELAEAVETLLEHSGQVDVAVVAHSMGGLALREYLGNGGADLVHTAVFVGTPHRGTWAAWLAWGAGGAEMRPGSPFLERLNQRTLPPRTRAFCLRTPIDTRVLPGRSAWLEDAVCHMVRTPTHPRMLRHSSTLHLIRRILLESAQAGAA